MQINPRAPLWINALLFAAVVALGYGLTVYFDSMRNPSSIAKEESAELQDFPFMDLTGQSRKLSDFKGKIVLINFWASWCAPCVKEFPALLKIAAENKDKLILVALSSDVSETDIHKFLSKQAEPTDNVFIVHDRDDVTLKIFSITQFPETVIADRNLKKRRKLVGAEWQPAELQKIIDSL